ncbi:MULTISPECIES: allene oxide cyclase barrel-like domain-containing protein [unclassified Streptomyces]|uniref:allene oxide cyclase barrel-like domain-containing protein n=1 Tax=unclassified Streptomyces TaxID=2593676 RepID=UPI002DDC577E|nr:MULTISPECIES: hypothetical protein [unclassified Streptomyces]WSA95898.1 hypothetical protein OIE63_33345 [Streptomyces sp. NBC_01795]WSB80313.1 hypothetical protein OHB04_34460 [Streptomyces sp. NBC_01775]WSS11476.1 hypothetical protein OG533_05760 [Streptomyces sp. NBC_01186]WSS40190.1 hypothetical protein OG220_05900 [Streptomyces sp. NBC_01187]
MTAVDRETQNAEGGSGGAGPVAQEALDSGKLAFQGEMPMASALEPRQLALAAALAAGIFTPGVDPVDEVLDKCVIVDGLTEVIEKLAINEGSKNGSTDSGDYVDGFFDSDGKRVGTVTGTAVMLAKEPHIWQHHKSVTEFEDGTFETTGVIDGTAILHGLTQVFRVVGKTGRYAGKQGFMTLTIKDPQQRPPHYHTVFAMA